MDLNNLEKVLKKEPKYRLKQAMEAVFKNFISNWSEAVFLPQELRNKLNKECPLLIEAETLISKDEDSVKTKITLKDGLKIEAVLMKHKDGRNTVCVSSQVGCPLGCLFCATGKMGFKRNLNYSEIIEQVIFFERHLKADRRLTSANSERVTNVTFMGMGEPFLNYEAVMKAVRILNDKDSFNIGARSISISTAGVAEGIEKLSEEGIQINLAISLHAPNNNLRSSLMPINKKYNIEKILNEVNEYIEKTKRKVMFEYVLIKGVNDSDECARELAKIMSNPSTLDIRLSSVEALRARKLYFVNLILYNAIPQNNFVIAGQAGIFKPSATKRVEIFKAILKKQGINFTQRYRFGQDIKAACGQFAS